ncbi:MAG: 2-vinyl bacteriochlorophyllide hydratase [Rubrivivax sp.]|jgi:3-vinyl bacteriochlorophyllide hydratase
MAATAPPGLYTPAQRARRDATVWTPVQGVLAPLQFGVFLVSLGMVLYSLRTGQALDWALGSVVVKTLLLYLIMITGCIWEKVVFGQYLFAPAFFWEDVMSMLVLALHTAYLAVWSQGGWQPEEQLALALAAYAAYALNALQYLRKLRMARMQGRANTPPLASMTTEGATP